MAGVTASRPAATSTAADSKASSSSLTMGAGTTPTLMAKSRQYTLPMATPAERR